MKTRIRNADVVFPNETTQVDVILEGTVFADIAPAVHTETDEVIDATGLVLLPGVIDDQVHFRDPGLTHKEDLATASRACAKGGVTTFLEMPNTNPPATTQRQLDEKLALAAQKSIVNYGFYIGATTENIADLKCIKRTPGIKIFIGSSTGNMLVDEQEALERIFAETTLPICAHCEDETIVRANTREFEKTNNVADHSKIRSREAAVVSSRRAIGLAKKYNHRFHLLHVSTRDELALLKDHAGLITAEVCPHHLFFNTNDYERLGTLVQMNPSLKDQEDNQALWQALVEGTIQVVATDHAPHTLEEKLQRYPASPSGLPAVENSLALMLNQVNAGRCTLQQVASWMSQAPAKIWNIVHKGEIRVGYDADFVLVDMKQTNTILNEEQRTKCGWSPWHGESLTGWPVQTWVMGQQVFREGRITATQAGRPAVYDHARGGYWTQK